MFKVYPETLDKDEATIPNHESPNPGRKTPRTIGYNTLIVFFLEFPDICP